MAQTWVVITRFNEDVAWARDVPRRGVHRLFIYNKGDRSTIPEDLLRYTVDLPNVGRDAHAVLTHILTFWDEIRPDDLVVFLQGHPFDHCDGGLDGLWPRLVPVGTAGFSLNFLDTTAWGAGAAKPSFQLRWYRDHALSPTVLNEAYGPWFERVVGRPLSPVCRWVWGAIQFSVAGWQIHSKRKELFESLLREVSDDRNPEAVHFIERAFSMVFAEDWILAHDLPGWSEAEMSLRV